MLSDALWNASRQRRPEIGYEPTPSEKADDEGNENLSERDAWSDPGDELTIPGMHGRIHGPLPWYEDPGGEHPLPPPYAGSEPEDPPVVEDGELSEDLPPLELPPEDGWAHEPDPDPNKGKGSKRSYPDRGKGDKDGKGVKKKKGAPPPERQDDRMVTLVEGRHRGMRVPASACTYTPPYHGAKCTGAFDIGGVITRKNKWRNGKGDPDAVEDARGIPLWARDQDAALRAEVPGAVLALKTLLNYPLVKRKNMWIVSKAGPAMQKNIRRWMSHVQFVERTGWCARVDLLYDVENYPDWDPAMGNMRFCRERSTTWRTADVLGSSGGPSAGSTSLRPT